MRLVARRGPARTTIGAVAEELGAPTGSIYHRFASRDVLLAEAWLCAVESFQGRFLHRLREAEEDPIDGGIRTIRAGTRWVRRHPDEARLLLCHRRQDLVAGEWPEEVRDRAEELGRSLRHGLEAYARARFGTASREALARTRFALVEAPYGALRPHVAEGRPPPPIVDRMLIETFHAVIGGER